MEAIRQTTDSIKKFGGVFTVEVTRDGKNGPVVLERRIVHNTVVNDGKLQLLRMAGGLQTNLFDQMRIGTSAATVNSAQTNLLSPITGTINTVDSITMSGRTLQLVISYPSGGGSKSASGIAEMVILNQNTSPGGSCFARGLISPTVNKTTADKLTITYEVRIT
jgi:hypothetical protein